jgi:hypothetical protein
MVMPEMRGDPPRRGKCRRCGRSALLGERWKGRPSTPVPSLWCGRCERSYPKGWSKGEVGDAVEQTTGFAYALAAAS